MLPTAGNKGERRNLRGSARLSSKMSGRPPRLRALRPRSQQQRTRTDATRRSEGNLKVAASREEELDAKRCDEEEKKAEVAGKTTTDMEGTTMANEMDVVDDDDDNDDEEEEEVTMTAITNEGNQEPTPDDGDDVVDVDIEMRSEGETIEMANEQASYECKSCKPSKMLPDIKAYFEHLRKEHKCKVSPAKGRPFLPRPDLYPRFMSPFCALVFVSSFFPFFFFFFFLHISFSFLASPFLKTAKYVIKIEAILDALLLDMIAIFSSVTTY